MKRKIARIILIPFAVIIACVLFFACGSKSTTKAESSHAELYELYVLDADAYSRNGFGSSGLTLYNNYKVKSENIDGKQEYGNVVVTYNATDGTQIIFANNGITIISPKGHGESFTQGYMRRIGDGV